MVQQIKDFIVEREHCYTLISRLEEDIQQLQEQNHTATQVLEARSQQIGRLLQEKGVIRMRIKEIVDYVAMKCHECEDMTRSMFFASVMSFVRQVMADLEYLQEEIERVMRNPEQEQMARKMKSLEQSLKNLQCLSGQKSVSYPNLCMFPHVHLPVGFKTPKFEKYDGHGDSIAHLKRYCNQLRGAGEKEELLMAYFRESLTGIASEWYIDQDISHCHIWDDLARDFIRQFQYNVDIAPDRNYLTNFKKKTAESFCEYAIKWREQAARVKPPMDETEMVNVFLQAQEADYFQNMMSAIGKPFAEAIKIGEMVENGLKTGRIISQFALRATSQAIQNGSRGLANRKKREEGAMMASALKAIIAIANSEARPKAAAKQAINEKKITPTPQVAEKRKVTLNVPKGTYVVRGAVISPRLTEPVVISRAPQSPIRDPTAVPWNYSKIVVTYKGKEIMGEANKMNQPRKYHNPEEQKKLKLSKGKRFPPKKPVLLKTLNEAYIPVETSVEQLERMDERFFKVNRISFSRDDFPQEGAAHNKTLHLTVKCEGYYMKRVMLDGRSRVNIFPLSTPQRMEIRTERIRSNNVCVCAFDGVKRDTIREIDLILTIGPVDFEVTFQVLYMDTSYNFLLGRPWIHATGVVPSTLHQMVKFKHENQEIIVHGEDEQSIYRELSVPCLEAREGGEHIVYKDFEIVVTDQCEEGLPFPQPCLSNVSVMVATEMIKHGYKPGKGLGVSPQVIIEHVTSTATEKFFGVGFRATEADRKWADERKKNGWVLPQPVPHLAKSFVEPKYIEEEEEEEAFMAEEIKDICEAMK
ncbi:uncharacterized protein [Nicotiana tomentosiformis]|uniref:uncharacterized protein n=1 Tax=Nicotiana tomentosiformis TaxID=4098 RepID=UPI00388CE65A